VGTQACVFIIHLALVFLLILLALSLEQFVWFICYYGVYETMFYALYVLCGTLCLFKYEFVSLWYMCEMAMEFGPVSRYYHIWNSILIGLPMKRYASYKLLWFSFELNCVDAHI
jgi:hypothetical protein